MPMKPFNKNKMKKAFWEGKTTIYEDKLLKGESKPDELEYRYFRYLETELPVPLKLESIVWNSVKKNQQIKRKLIVKWAIAASATLLIGTFMLVYKQKQQTNLDMQFSVLEHTLNHLSNEINTSSTDNVLYKDEYIIIVANN